MRCSILSLPALIVALIFCGSCLHFHSPQTPSGITGPRQAIVTAKGDDHSYTITAGGNVDDFNTKPVIYLYSHQPPGFYLNRSVTIENTGDQAIRNPRVVVDGRGPAWTVDELVGRLTLPDDTDAAKARDLYEWMRANVVHGTDKRRMNTDPVMLFNAFGYALCDENSDALARLWETVGLKSFRGAPRNHSTTVVEYDGATHLMDGNFRAFFLDRDNRTIVPEEALAHDPDLVMRGAAIFPAILSPEKRYFFDLKYRGIQHSPGPRTRRMPLKPPQTLADVLLRPGEIIAWTWEDVDEPFRWNSLKSSASHRFRHLYKGRIIYEPELTAAFLNQTNIEAEGLTAVHRVFRRPMLKPAAAAQDATLAVISTVPTFLLDATIELEFSELESGGGMPIVSVALDNGAAKEVDGTADDSNPALIRYELKGLIGAAAANATPQNTLTITLRWPAGQDTSAPLLGYLHNFVFQVNHTGMPALRLGDNAVVFHADEPENPRVRITHDWFENWDLTPPAPPRPLSPIGPVDNLQPEFRWEFANPGDETNLKYIHIQVFDREDLRWPVANALEPLYDVGRFPDAVTAWRPHRPGLINPGQRYWWRMRIMPDGGAWSDWSATQSFVPDGPMRPVDVEVIETDGRWRLSWRPHPEGTRPAHYEIHASSEYGFTAYDRPFEYMLPSRRNQWDILEEIEAIQPATLLHTTPETSVELDSLLRGDSCSLLAPSYFRVIAVDATGARSDSSEFASLPSPLILAPARVHVQPGDTVEIPVTVAYSLGAYRSTRTKEAVYHLKYWNRQSPQVDAAGLPDWLALDEDCGRLSGRAPEDFQGDVAIRLTVFDANKPADRHAWTMELTAE